MNIEVRYSDMGPLHDPYLATTVIVTNGDHAATFYEDGLGSVRLTLTTEGELMRAEEFVTGYNARKDVAAMLKAAIWFRRHVGISIDDAIETDALANSGPKLYM